MICNIFGIYFWNEVQAFLLPAWNTNRVASGFTSLGYNFKQVFLLKTTSVDSMTIPSFTQAFSQAQGDDRGILAQMY